MTTQQIEPVTQAEQLTITRIEVVASAPCLPAVKEAHQNDLRDILAIVHRLRTTPAPSQQITLDEDELTEILDDSLDMDWTGRVGARAIIRHYERQSK